MCEREKGGGNERDEKDAGKDLRSRAAWGGIPFGAHLGGFSGDFP